MEIASEQGQKQQGGRKTSALVALIASAFFWAWFDSGVFRPTFLLPFDASGSMFLPCLVAAIATGGVVLLMACLCQKKRPFTSQNASNQQPSAPHKTSIGASVRPWIAAAALALAGTVASLAGAATNLLAVAVVGAAAVGASCGVFQIAWGTVYAQGGSEFAGKTAAASIALGVLLDTLVMGLGNWFAAAFTAAMPLVSAGIAIYLTKEEGLASPEASGGLSPAASADATPDPAARTAESVFGSHRLFAGLPASLLVAFALFGLSFGYCQQSAVFAPVDVPNYSSDVLIAARGITALAIFALLTRFPSKAYTVFKTGTLVGIAGFVAAPLLGLIETQGIASSIVIAVGYTTFDIATWALMAELVRATGETAGRVVGSGRAAIHFAETVAIIACAALSAFPNASAALTSTFGYGCVIAEMLLLADNSALWLLIRAERGEDVSELALTGQPSAAAGEPPQAGLSSASISEIAATYALTGRESEVLALLLAGHGRARVAQSLGISENTLGSHIQQLYRKIGVHSRQELLDRFGA